MKMSRAYSRPLPEDVDHARSWRDVATEFMLGDPTSLPWAVRVRRSSMNLAAYADLRAAPILTYTVDEEDSYADLSLTATQLPRVLTMLRERPFAAITLAVLLRTTENSTIVDALAAESLAYSALQAGPEYAEWLSTRRTPAPSTGEESHVYVTENDSVRQIILDRPQAANAIDAFTRAELHTAFRACAVDDAPVEWLARGRHFCTGGDLAEFGLVDSPTRSHLMRMQQNLPAAVAAVGSRLTARVHGAVIGAGMELSSFAHRVIASPDTRWRLPEVKMGLLPGCGGTVSIPRRIGRQRTLLLTLTGQVLDAQTALRWRLVDEISSE
ncbi:enoyl-CoA hydratase/isomerase family protein [Microbacterium sp. A588]